MPYNNTPIEPNHEITGTVSLPLARVKKIIHADEDLGNCSTNAAFAITVATELFLQYIVEQSHNVARAERKPRRNIQYKDVANAVARIDNLEFLTDVIPRTVTYKAFREKQSKGLAAQANGQHHQPESGSTQTLNGTTNGAAQHHADVMDIDVAPGTGLVAPHVNGASPASMPPPAAMAPPR